MAICGYLGLSGDIWGSLRPIIVPGKLMARSRIGDSGESARPNVQSWQGAPEWAILLLRACARMRDSDGGRALEWAIRFDSRTRINDSDLIFFELDISMRN